MFTGPQRGRRESLRGCLRNGDTLGRQVILWVAHRRWIVGPRVLQDLSPSPQWLGIGSRRPARKVRFGPGSFTVTAHGLRQGRFYIQVRSLSSRGAKPLSGRGHQPVLAASGKQQGTNLLAVGKAPGHPQHAGNALGGAGSCWVPSRAAAGSDTRRVIARAVPLALAAPGNAQRRCRMHAEFIVRAPSAAVVRKEEWKAPCAGSYRHWLRLPTGCPPFSAPAVRAHGLPRRTL